MIELQNSSVIKRNPPIVELVGPAGAGKTTLAKALSHYDERILVGAELELRKIEHIPIIIGHAPFLLPLFLRRCRSSRWFTWDEIKAMAYLKVWPRVLSQPTSNNDTVVLLDQGPVFKLATLDAFGPERLKTKGYETWWRSMFEKWAFTLDMVVWLDAPDTILAERINSRCRWHAVKGKPEIEACKFLSRYRTSYEQILAKLTVYGRPPLLQFDTSQTSIEQIADEVLIASGFKLSENGT